MKSVPLQSIPHGFWQAFHISKRFPAISHPFPFEIPIVLFLRCGCSASTLCGYILNKLEKKVWKHVLFVPTGALLSPVSSNEGNTIPGIAHGVVIEAV